MDKNIVKNVLSKFRSLFNYISIDYASVLKEIMKEDCNRYMVFPCDVIDLRNFFKNDSIEFNGIIPLFNYNFSEKYLKENSIFLIFDAERIPFHSEKYGCTRFFFTNKFKIKDNLIRIVLNYSSSNDTIKTIQNIISEFSIGAEFLVSNSIPSISKTFPKVSMKTAQIENEIALTPSEREIFNVLINAKKEFNLNVNFRVVGGWVRDKLLNKNSDDIDIAVEMPGFDLAKYIYSYGSKYNLNIKEPYQVSLDKSTVPVSLNEKSSDLMVGSVKINDIKIEFVPMRTEYYPDPNSRQPVITTTNNPQEDAKRRDLTINALFYNIETGKVEDYVGGKNDLLSEKILLRTPDEPNKTFVEDPLRILRVLRFHSRYPNSIIENSIIESFKNPTIHESYAKKVATERAGPEIVKMMMGDNPVDSIKILFDTNLYKTVFKVPSMDGINPDGIHMDQKTRFHRFNLKDHTLEVIKNLNNIMKENKESDYMRGLLNLAALFHDFGKMKTQKPHPKEEGRMMYHGHEDVSSDMAEEILKSIGIGKEDRDIVNQVIRLHMRPHQAGEWSDKAKGRFLRETRMHGKEEKHKDLWKYIFYHSQADGMASTLEDYNQSERDKDFNDFSNFVNSPSGSFSRPLLNGNDVINIFNKIDSSLTPDTGYIREVLDIIREKQYQGIIDVSFAFMPDGEEKNKKMDEAKIQAENEVRKIAPIIIKKYKKTDKKDMNMSSNWFKKIKESQAVENGVINNEANQDTKSGPGISKHKFYVGMKVRDRRRGLSNNQEYGVVSSVNGNKITITWSPDDKKKKRIQKFDAVENTEILSFIVSEV